MSPDHQAQALFIKCLLRAGAALVGADPGSDEILIRTLGIGYKQCGYLHLTTEETEAERS